MDNLDLTKGGVPSGLVTLLSSDRIHQIANQAEDAIYTSNSRRADVVIIENAIRKALMEAAAKATP